MTAALEALAAKWEREAKLAERAALLDGVPGSSEAIYECAAELRAALAESGWRPIETLPDDVTHCWVGHAPSRTMIVAHRTFDIWHIMWDGNRVISWAPTHWMPLPSPPEPPR